jgi:ATP-binding cassette, subfamily B, bacterial
MMEAFDPALTGLSLRVRSSSPGRLRLDVSGLRGRPSLAAAIEAALVGLPEVSSSTADARSGGLLIAYPHSYTADDVEAAVEGRLSMLGNALDWPRGTGRSPLSEVLSRAMPGWTDRVGPIMLTVGAHSLDVFEGMLSISIVHVASGVPPRTLTRLGITKPTTQLKVVGAAGVAVAGAEMVAQHYRKRAWRRLARSTEDRLRSDVFRRLEAQDLSFFDEQGTGPLLNLLTDQVAVVGTFVAAIDEVIEFMVTAAVSGVALLRASPGVALISGLAFPTAFLPARLLGRKAGGAFHRRASDDARLTQVLENILAGIIEVFSFTAEDQEAERVAGLSRAVAESSATAEGAAFMQASVLRNVFLGTASAAVWYGARQVIGARMPRHELTSVIYWIPRLMGAFGGAAQLSGTYYAAKAGAERLCRVLESMPTIESGPTRLGPGAVRGEISVEELSFGYDQARPVLRGLSLQAPAASTLGIVGPSGSGKSTLLWLLLRFYEPQAGVIRLDGYDIRDLDLKDLRSSIGLVSQDVYLFDDTVENNVRYSRPTASEDEVAAALASAGVGDLPSGIRASVGERGHRLSGGQRQRIALARALLKDAPILALDEATSHLDYQTEAAIKSSLRREASNRTILLIAHRLASVRDADNIVVIDHGRVLEQGTHDQLLDQGGLYHRLWHLEVG